VAESRTVNPAGFFAKVLADQHYEKGLEAQRQGDWERALASYRRACAVDAHNVLFLLARGHVCQAHGLDAEAEECYRRALELRPDDTVVLYNQAQLFAARGLLDAARRNLARIAAGDVEALGERAALVYNRLGDIALRDEDYATAAIHFRRAREATPGDAYAAAALAALPRFAEFERPLQPGGQMAPKVAFYAYSGALLLGLPGSDDGIAIPPYPPLGFDSTDELAHTLRRFVDVAQGFGWGFDCVAALEPEGQPLAVALAAAFGARLAAEIESVPHGSVALGVAATAAHPPDVSRRMKALGERASTALTYAAGVARPVWEYAPAIEVASLPVRVEFPWNRSEVSAAEHAEAFGAELAALLAAAPPDASVAAQLHWYREHGRLCFEAPGPAGVAHPARHTAPA
jgi:Flp pilus assembly protein TadD